VFFYPTSSFGKLHTYALHYPQHNACEFSNDLITYISDNLTFNDNSLCKVWRKFVCTAYQENRIRFRIRENDSVRWGNKKFRVMSPIRKIYVARKSVLILFRAHQFNSHHPKLLACFCPGNWVFFADIGKNILNMPRQLLNYKGW
jgi:hypothetical protein